MTPGRIAAAIALDRLDDEPTPLTELAALVREHLRAIEAHAAAKVDLYSHRVLHDAKVIEAIGVMDRARLALVAAVDARPAQLVDNLARGLRDAARPSWIARLWRRLTGGR